MTACFGANAVQICRRLGFMRHSLSCTTRACASSSASKAEARAAGTRAETPQASTSHSDRLFHLRRHHEPAFQPELYTVPPPMSVPSHIPRPSYALTGVPRQQLPEEYAEVKGEKAIDRMRRANRLAAQGRLVAEQAIAPGVTTAEVDRIVTEFFIAHGAYPVGINYCGFPRSICASPNEVAVHGVPNTRPLQEGDIVNFDVCCYIDEAFGDNSRTFCVGKVDAAAATLVELNERCVVEAIANVAGPGQKLHAIADFIVDFAEKHGYGVVSEFAGHFIGSELHMKPNVLHSRNRDNLVLKPGMTFTIEPIFTEGLAELEGPCGDGWTYLSKDRSWSAQFEETIVITEHGAEILSVP